METGHCIAGSVASTALKPSLEGWKHARHDLRAEAFHPLKPSLEGWKPLLFTHSLQGRRPLKPSLEGWKPECPGGAHDDDQHLETFLRGMETSISILLPRHPSALKPSLEGWKQWSRPSFDGVFLALKPSLEGWKPTTGFFPVFFFLKALKPSLEGWKQRGQEDHPSQGMLLETFLRGMETR